MTASAHFTAHPDGTLTCRYGHVVGDGELAEHFHPEPNRNHMARGGWVRPGAPLLPPVNGCIYSASEVAGYGMSLLDALNRPAQEEPR